MPCEVLISRASGSAFGEIVAIKPAGHTWGRLETMAAWVASGNDKATWPGDYFLLKVSDMTQEEAQSALSSRHLWRLQRRSALMRRLDQDGEDTINRTRLIASSRAKVGRARQGKLGQRTETRTAKRGSTGEAEPYTRGV